MYERVFGIPPAVHSSLRERAAVLAMASAMGSAAHRVAKPIEYTGSALDLLRGRRDGIEEWEVPLADHLSRTVSATDIDRCEALIAELEERGVRVVTILEPAYPTELRMAGSPPVLFVRGVLPPARRAVAVTGCRRPSAAGLRRAAEIARALAASGIVVVSGLAQGIDACAHGAAMDAGGTTVAVLPAGIDHVYPPGNDRLAAEIACRGAVVSHLAPGTAPSRYTFPLRMPVVSGLSAGVVVVEGLPGAASGMQARVALTQGRPVFFCEGLSADEPWAARQLERGFGQVVGSAEEAVDSIIRLTNLSNGMIVR